MEVAGSLLRLVLRGTHSLRKDPFHDTISLVTLLVKPCVSACQCDLGLANKLGKLHVRHAIMTRGNFEAAPKGADRRLTAARLGGAVRPQNCWHIIV